MIGEGDPPRQVARYAKPRVTLSAGVKFSRRWTSRSSHICEGGGAKSIVLNQGLHYIRRPWAVS